MNSLAQIQYRLAQLSRFLDSALIVVCGVLLCLMASLVFFEVLIRFALSSPTAWTEEAAQFMLIWYGLLAAAVGARKGLHFAIRLGLLRYPAEVRWAIRQGVNLLVVVFLTALLMKGIDYLAIVADQTSTGTEINMRIPWAAIPVGVGAILTMYLLDLADAALSFWTGRQLSVKEAREEEIYRALKGERSDREGVVPGSALRTVD